MMMRSLLLFLILNLVVNTPGTLGQDKLEFQLENKMRRHYEVDGGDTRGRNLVNKSKIWQIQCFPNRVPENV
jgi:hypothetical protein